MVYPIYLDNQATTPLDPIVLDSMMPYFNEKFGNASSSHHIYGQEAKQAVEYCRATISKVLRAKPREIIFTSGATEAINLGIKGIVEKGKNNGCHIITQETEHKAVLDTYHSLKKKGLVKIKNFHNQKNKLQYMQYVLTPKGVAERTKLTINFMKRKMREYEELKKELRADLKKADSKK